MAQQSGVVLNTQLPHKQWVKNSQVSCKWEEIFIDLKVALADRNKYRDCKNPSLPPNRHPLKPKD